MPHPTTARYRARDGTEHHVARPHARGPLARPRHGRRHRDRRRDADRPRRPARPGARARARLRRRTAGLPPRRARARPAARSRGPRSRRSSDARPERRGPEPRGRQRARRPPISAPEARCGSCAPSPQACAAACGSPTGACSPARCRPSATARSSSGCCTPTPPSSSSSRPARAAPTAGSRSTAAAEPEHFLPGGAGGDRDWLAALLAHAERIVAGAYAPASGRRRPREEVFVGVAPRTRRAATSTRSPHTRFLWVDVDRPERLDALWAFLAERPCHLLIESGGSGGVHAYWKLAEPLPATRLEPATGEVDRADRARPRADHPRARRRRATGGPTSPTRAAPSARA